jgi:hypothetical protein
LHSGFGAPTTMDMLARQDGLFAAECLRVAAKVNDRQTKAALFTMVDAWLFLAKLVDKNAAAAP